MSDPLMPPPPAAPDSILRLAASLYRQKMLIAGCAAIGAIIAAVFSLLAAPRYRADAQIALEEHPTLPAAGGLAALASQFGASGFGGTRSLQFYASVVTGRDVLRRMAVDTFPDPAQGGRLRPLLDILGAPGNTPERRLAAAANMLRDGVVRTTTNDRTGTLAITAESRYPELSAQIVQRLYERLERFDFETRRTAAGERRRFAERELTRAQTALAATEDTLRAFLEANRSGLDVPRLRVGRQRLERRVQTAEDVYTNFVRELQEARIAEVRDLPAFTLVETPVVPLERVYPLRKRMTLLGLLLGTGVGIALAIARASGWSARLLDPAGYAQLRDALRGS
jgi:uncharacterized protein involved in exopolysaccharide biosynthesis